MNQPKDSSYTLQQRKLPKISSPSKLQSCQPNVSSSSCKPGLDTTENTTRALREYLGEKKAGLVFPSKNGTPLQNRDIVFDVLHPLCDKLGLKRGGMHAFRHGRVSLMRANGAPEDLVKRQIGHSSLRTTSGYTHFSEEYQKQLANKLSWTHFVKLDSLEAAVSAHKQN